MATMALSVIFISPITIAVSVFSFRRGLDPDIVAYPIISTIADIIITACYISSLTLLFTLDYIGFYVIGILDLAFLSFVLYIFIKNIREKMFAKMIREFLLTLVLVTVIVNVTGAFLQEISGITSNGTQIYIVYPALITTIGGLGAIVGSTATTKLALGVIRPSFSSIRQHLDEIGGAWVASMVMFAFYFVISSSISGVFTLGDSLKYAGQLLVTNALAAFIMVLVSYAVAVSTYRRGWDPDNFVIPFESSLADGVTTISLLIALTAII
jgi:mgtE-like transporter